MKIRSYGSCDGNLFSTFKNKYIGKLFLEMGPSPLMKLLRRQHPNINKSIYFTSLNKDLGTLLWCVSFFDIRGIVPIPPYPILMDGIQMYLWPLSVALIFRITFV